MSLVKNKKVQDDGKENAKTVTTTADNANVNAEYLDDLRLKCRSCSKVYSCLSTFKKHACENVTTTSTKSTVGNVQVQSDGRLKCLLCKRDFKNKACFTRHRLDSCRALFKRGPKRKASAETANIETMDDSGNVSVFVLMCHKWRI